MPSTFEVLNRHVAGNLKGFFSSKAVQKRKAVILDFVSSRKSIQRELLITLESANTIGIYSRVLGRGLFIVGVKDILPSPGGDMVILHPEDITGRKLKTIRLAIDEIQTVVPFPQTFTISNSRGKHPN